MSARELIVFVLQASIIATVFGFGLKATSDDLLYVFKRPRHLVRSVLAMFVIMPIAAILLAMTFDFRHPVEGALVAVSISPVPPLLPRKQEKGGGNASYGLGLMVTMALLSLAFIPLALHLLGQYYDRALAIQPMTIARIIFTAVVLPLLLGMLCNRFIPKLAHAIARPAILAGKILLPVAAVAVLVAAHRAFGTLLGDGTLVAFVLFVAIGLVVGHLLGGPSPEEREVLALSTACRHPGIAIAIAAANVGAFDNDRQVPAAILLYLVVSILATLPYMKWQSRRLASAR